MNDTLICERLILTPLGSSDLVALHELWTEASVRHFLWDGQVIPLERTREIAETNARLFADRLFGIWGIREAGLQALIGFAGFWHFRTPPSLELLFGVAADHWNRGIATEAAQRVIRHGFDGLAFDAIVGSTDPANVASIRVMEKCGMTFVERREADGLDTVFYQIARDGR